MTGGGASWAARLGIPPLRGRASVVLAIVMDTFGVGLMLPISLLYFTIVTDVSVARLGLLMSVAMFLALPTGLLGGVLVDRFSAKHVMVANNLLSAAGYCGYYFASNEAVIFAGVLLVAVSEAVFWACWMPYIKGLAANDGFAIWFAFIEAAKAGCLVLGAGLTAVFLASADPSAARVLVLANIATSLVAAVLIGRHRISGVPAKSSAPDPVGVLRRSATRWSDILRDRRYVAMTAGQFLATPISLLGGLAFPVFFVQHWHLPAWTGPALFALSNLMVLIVQPPFTRLVRNVSHRTLLVWSAVLAVLGMALLAVPVPAGSALAVGIVVALVSIVVLTMSGIIFFPTTNTALSASVTEHNAGRVTALFHTGTSVATACTPVVVGALFGFPNLLWIVVTLLYLAGVTCFQVALRPA